MKNLIFKKQLIILISVFILIAGISAVSANENTTDLHQSMEAYDNNVINTDLEVDDNNIIQPNNTDVKSNVSIDINNFEMYYKNGTKLTGKLFMMKKDLHTVQNGESAILSPTMIRLKFEEQEDLFIYMPGESKYELIREMQETGNLLWKS